jgi:hypothetical protein
MAIREVSERMLFPFDPRQEVNASIIPFQFVQEEPDVDRILASWKSFCASTNMLIRKVRCIHSRYTKSAVLHSGKVIFALMNDVVYIVFTGY